MTSAARPFITTLRSSLRVAAPARLVAGVLDRHAERRHGGHEGAAPPGPRPAPGCAGPCRHRRHQRHVDEARARRSRGDRAPGRCFERRRRRWPGRRRRRPRGWRRAPGSRAAAASAAAVTREHDARRPSTAVTGSAWRVTPAGVATVGRVVAAHLDPGGGQVGGDERARLARARTRRCTRRHRRLDRSTYSTPSAVSVAAQAVDVEAQLAGGQPGRGWRPPWPPAAWDRSSAHAASAAGHDHDPVVVGAHHVAGVHDHAPPSTTGTFTDPGLAFTVPWHDTWRDHTAKPIARSSAVSRTPASMTSAAHAAGHQRGGQQLAEHAVGRRRRVGHHQHVARPAHLDGGVDHQVVARVARHGDGRARQPHALLDRPEVRAGEAPAADRLVHGGGAEPRPAAVGGARGRPLDRDRTTTWRCHSLADPFPIGAAGTSRGKTRGRWPRRSSCGPRRSRPAASR